MRPLFRSVVLASLIAVSRQVHADDATLRKALTANYVKIDLAFKKNDPVAFSNMLTADYTCITADGKKFDHTQMIANFTRERKTLQQAEMQSTLETLSTKDNQIVAAVNVRLSGIMSDPKNQPHKFLILGVHKDTWVKSNGVWKIKLYQVLKQSMTMDGKPLQPAVSGKEPDMGGKQPLKSGDGPGKTGNGPDKGGH